MVRNMVGWLMISIRFLERVARRWAVLLAAAVVSGFSAPTWGDTRTQPSLKPDSKAMGEADARHFLGRVAFVTGASGAGTSGDASAPLPPIISEMAGLSRENAVARLLAPDGVPREVALPAEITYRSPAQVRALDDMQRKELQRQQGMAGRVWWLERMLEASTPAAQIQERMTLFWHNHFVSSIEKVKIMSVMLEQNQLLRRHALGNFGQMLHEVSKSPAMVVYLDGASNRRGSPNENFAREVMELFTLGEGHYSEADVKEAARAFTGWSVEPATGEFRWRPRQHDDGEKNIFGRRGQFDGDAVLDLLLQRPETAQFVTRKLWREFVSPTPDEAEVKRIATRFRESGYEIRVVMRELLLSNAFWAEENRMVLIKSPVDLVVGTVRSLDVELPDTRALALLLRNLGQDLLAPPNVRGWPGGEYWINSSSLLMRKQFIERLGRRARSDMTALLAPEYQLK